MRNPYLWQKSLRATLFTALFPLLVAKFATVLMLISVASEHAFSVDPISGMALAAIGASIILDLWAIYHLTTRWHRLNRHPWVIMPGALANLALAASAILPIPFAVLFAALESFLGDSPAVTWGIWAPLSLAAILACVQVIVSLRLALRLRQLAAPPAPGP